MAFELCETPVESSFLPRRLEEFGGDTGAELIRMELQTAVEDLTREISSRICGPNQSASSFANQIALPTRLRRLFSFVPALNAIWRAHMQIDEAYAADSPGGECRHRNHANAQGCR